MNIECTLNVHIGKHLDKITSSRLWCCNYPNPSVVNDREWSSCILVFFLSTIPFPKIPFPFPYISYFQSSNRTTLKCNNPMESYFSVVI